MAKKGPDLLYPVGLRGNPTGEAVRATSWTAAKRKLARYQRSFGSNYYLMNGVPYAEHAGKFREVFADAPPPAPPARARREEALARQERMMRQQHLDD